MFTHMHVIEEDWQLVSVRVFTIVQIVIKVSNFEQTFIRPHMLMENQHRPRGGQISIITELTDSLPYCQKDILSKPCLLYVSG